MFNATGHSMQTGISIVSIACSYRLSLLAQNIARARNVGCIVLEVGASLPPEQPCENSAPLSHCQTTLSRPSASTGPTHPRRDHLEKQFHGLCGVHTESETTSVKVHRVVAVFVANSACLMPLGLNSSWQPTCRCIHAQSRDAMEG